MSIFKSYDIRGVYPTEINEENVYKIARAYIEFTKFRKIVVGRDMRLSSPMLYSAIVRGLIDQGTEVIDVGEVSTPMFYYAVNKLDADGGMVITASHNPKEYNGLKLVKQKAEPIGEDSGLKDIEKVFNEDHFQNSKSFGVITQRDLTKDYVNYVKSFGGNIHGLKIVIDCGNGMAGKTISGILKDFELNIVLLYDKLDGSFPNHQSDPTKDENIRELQKKILEEKADLGLAFDGDADRLILIDEKGLRVPGDITTAIIAKEILTHQKEKVLFDLRSSKSVPELIKNEGGIPIISKVGHSFIKKRMRDEGIFFAGELSGHYYFKDNFYTDSADIAMMKILSLFGSSGKKVSEFVKSFSKYYHSGEVNRNVADKDAVISRVEQKYKDGKVSHIDGVTIEFEHWWFNLRKSNTEPVVRLNLEADTKELMTEKLNEVTSLIK
ncbi:Phosphomannomutase [Candidatus Tiddalikarchaeum anstoanum]|nr:Phosphomannomutase [Candidatus Tiddalikarchaeum anstoanum]